MTKHHVPARPRVTASLRHYATLFLALVIAMPVLMAVPAAPAAAQAADDGLLRILLFTKQPGHGSWVEAAQVVRDQAARLGAEYGQPVEITETADAGAFSDANLATYDTVVFPQNGGVLFDDAQRDAFQGYIQAGGGYMGIHYAGWSRGQSEHDVWPWYYDLVGAVSEGHPAIQPGTVRVPDTTHPLVQDLLDDLDADDSFRRTDEWYDFELNPTANVHTLLEVDEFTYNSDFEDGLQSRRNGTSHPITWCQDFDGGRSWYSAMGHAGEYFSEEVIQDQMGHGLEYAAGLLAADCSPPVPDEVGAWSPVTPWPLVPINASLTREGLVQSFGSVITGNDPTPYAWDGNGPVFQGGQFQTDVWNPSQPRTLENVDDGVIQNTTYTDLFCSMQVQDPNSGKVLTAGGDDGLGENAPNDGSLGTTSYSSRDGLQAEAPMQYPRWYPTATTMATGDIVVQGGARSGSGGPGVLTPEIYTPDEGSGWRTLDGVESAAAYGDGGGDLGPDQNRWWYPRAFVAPGSGTLFNISGTQMFELDPYANDGDGELTLRGTLPAGIGNQGDLGNPVGATSTAVMYEPGKILQVGGGWWANGGGPDGARAGFTVDLTGAGGTAAPALEATPPMQYQRHWATSTLLPDGDVLVTGGGRTNNGNDGVVTNPEIWDSETNTWTTVEVPQEHARLYHSSALLLPDGRVMVGGGGTPGPRNYTDVEYYSPAYLFDGDQPAARPEIADAPASIGYDGTFQLGASTGVSRVTLVRNGSVTHGFNNDQRFQDLTFTQAASGELTIDAPIDSTYAPPGAYMVFVFDEDGTPSVASMMDIDPTVEMDHRTPDVVEQFEYPRNPVEWRGNNPPTVVAVAPGDGRMAPWAIDSQVELIRAKAGSNGGLGLVGYHLALGDSGSLQRRIDDLQPGREYRISLRYARDSRAAAGAGDATATVAIGSLDTDLTSATPSQQSGGWETTFETYVGTFTPDERSETLTLSAGDGAGMVLDNLVIISQQPGLDDASVHYEFSEGEGTTAANTGTDFSTGPATLVGATGWSPDGVFGSALDLPGGEGNHVDLPDDLLAGATDLSVSLWVNPDQAAGGFTPLFNIGNGTASYFQIQTNTQADGPSGLAATYKAPDGPEERVFDATNDPDLTPGQWNHVVFTRQGATGTLYLNGAAVASRDDLTIDLADLGSTADNWLANNGFPDPTIAALMDDVRLYTSDLTADDVAALYADGSALRTTTTVSVDPASPSPFGESLTVTATVADSAGQPAEGSAELYVDGVRSGEAAALADGSVAFPALELSPGDHEIEVRYLAAAGSRDSRAVVTHTVERPPPGEGVPIHYTFDEGQGTTAANTGSDPSVGDATLLGQTGWTPDGQFGPAVSLPGGPGGSDNYVDLPDNLTAGMDDEFSVSVWARPDALPNWVPLFQVGSSTDTFFLLQSSTQVGGPSGFAATFKAAGNPEQERLTLGAGNDLPLDEWTHVVFTMRGSTGRIYFDGELVGERTDFTLGIGDVGVDGTTTANFLGNTSWPDPVFDGLADDLRIYGYELSAEDVTDLFEGPSTEPDTTAPVVSTELAGDQDADGAYIGAATATVTAADEPNGSGVASIEYALDDDVFVVYEETLTVTEPGEHVLQTRATDVAGNVSEVVSTSFTIAGDVTEPLVLDVTVDPAKPNGRSPWYVSPVTVMGTTADDATVEFNLDGAGWIAADDGSVVVDADGTHTVEARAVRGDEVSEVQSVDIALDATTPTLDVAGISDGQEFVAGSDDEVTWSADDATSGVRIVRVRLDGTIIDGDLPDGGSFIPGDAAPGDHELFVRAHDVAGNFTTRRIDFTVVEPPDTTQPQVTIDGVANGAILGDSEVLTVTATATDDTAVDRVQLNLDGVAIATGASPQQVSLALWELDLGTHALRAIATDTAGNRRARQVEFTVRTTTDDVLINIDRFTDGGFMSTDEAEAVSTHVEKATTHMDRGKIAKARRELQRARDAARDVDNLTIRRLLIRDLEVLIRQL